MGRLHLGEAIADHAYCQSLSRGTEIQPTLVTINFLVGTIYQACCIVWHPAFARDPEMVADACRHAISPRWRWAIG